MVDLTDEMILALLDEVYRRGWDHGFESQSPLRIDDILNPYLFRLKDIVYPPTT